MTSALPRWPNSCTEVARALAGQVVALAGERTAAAGATLLGACIRVASQIGLYLDPSSGRPVNHLDIQIAGSDPAGVTA
jgi:hypothetical protein